MTQVTLSDAKEVVVIAITVEYPKP
ncbi:MAG: hypothetical protein JWR13_2436, partial [Mycobacterium sp.]|nr:hypothetical protein [Mycobacterium sp.]